MDTDRLMKCISEHGGLKKSRPSRELPIQGRGLIELSKVYPVTDIRI